DRTGNGQPTFYVDTVCLSNAPVPTPTPPPPPPPPGPPPPPPGPPAPRLPGVPGCTYTLYDDALASGWEDWSWDTNVAREHPYALSGRSLAFRYRAGYAGLSLRSPVALNRNDYDAVVFWITGGDLPWTNSTSDPGVRQIMFLLQSTDTGGESRRFHIDAPIKTWMPVTIPLALLGELTAIKRVNFQERTGQSQLPVFVDNICFVRGEFDLSGLAARAPGDVLLFDETTSEDYENWSWDTAISFANTAPAIGLRSIKVQHQKGYAGFSLRLKVGLNAANFGGITFRVHGGEQGRRQLDFLIQQTDDGGESRRVSFDVPAGQWYEVAIPLSALGDIKTIKRINIQDRSGKPQTYYLDNLLIVQRAVSLTLPVAAPSRRTTTQTATRPTGTARRSDILFDDALAAGWENWSWNTRADFANAQPALGRRSIAVRYNEGYAGLSLRSPVTLSAADYGGIAFWVHGGEHDHELRLFVQQSDTGGDSRGVPFEARAGVWTPITVPISFLGELRTLKRINIQDISGAPKGAFYVDAIRLVRGPITTTLTLPRTGPTQEGGYVIYSDMLAEGWENWSWNTQVNLGSREPVLIGSRSIEAQTKPGGGLSLRSPITLDGRSYGGIVFRIYGGETRARRLQLFLHLSDESGTETPSFIFDVAPRRWLTFNVPLSQLGNPATIKRVNFQDLSGASQTTFYVDEIELIPAREAPPPPQTPFEAIFGNILARGWRNASEGARVSFNNDRIARTMYAIAVQPQRAGAQFKLEARQPVSTSAFVALSFWVHGGEQGVNGLQALLYPASSDEPIVVSFDAPSNQWREIVIQLDAVSAIQAFAIRVPDDKASATFYVDDIRLLRKTGTP
ncbi:MAG: hypothetical protein RMM31_10400, partial [Anaerolineae bacterium]|nr:hypothetical protein [Anaerolineae bacterium]